MIKERRFPPIWRVLLGFVIAPAIIAAGLGWFQPMYSPDVPLVQRVWSSTVLYLVFGGYPAAFFVGLPAYFILRYHLKANILNCVIAGAGVSALPWAVLSLLLPGPDSAYSNGHVTHVNGARTFDGWMDLIAMLSSMAVLGALAGLLFWVVAAAGYKSRKATIKD